MSNKFTLLPYDVAEKILRSTATATSSNNNIRHTDTATSTNHAYASQFDHANILDPLTAAFDTLKNARRKFNGQRANALIGLLRNSGQVSAANTAPI